jgi:taurine dioxygenase
MIEIAAQAHGFGARVQGVDLSRPLTPDALARVKDAFTRHSVIFFADQALAIEDLERLTLELGAFGEDPFIAPMDGHAHVMEVRREADEKTLVFGAAWHSDWSFQASPPAATILYGEVIPPVGGDTLFADGYRAFEALSATMQAMLAPLRAVHSARRAYGPRSAYATDARPRSMKIEVSPEAEKSIVHPLVRTHPESGRKALFVNPVYTVGIEGMEAEEASAILNFLFAHMTQDRFVYRHHWAAEMLIMWDNRCALHTAEGGYDGHRRVMRRTTLAGERPV